MLNQEQTKAVESDAPLKIVVAGPGSGKTRTLCAGIAKALERGRKPESIAVVTFTNAAANELKTRLAYEYELDEPLGFTGTLHALCLTLVREHSEMFGLSQINVIDEDQQKSVLAEVMYEMKIKLSISAAQKILSDSMGGDVQRTAGGPTCNALLVKEYHRRLKAAGLLDFDMILRLGVEYVKQGAPQWPFECLFVDEMQDSGDLDAEFYFNAPSKEKFLVGDPDQSIFGFRGGNLQHMIDAPAKGFEVFKLETNYRSAIKICDHASSVITRNKSRVKKSTTPERKELGKVLVNNAEMPMDELCQLARNIGNQWQDTAVLSRTNHLLGTIIKHLQSNGFPVRTAVYKPEVYDWKRTKLLLTVLGNPWCDFTLHQLLKMDKGVVEANRIAREAAASMKSINEVMRFQYGRGEQLAADIDLQRHEVSRESSAKIQEAIKQLGKTWTVPDLLLLLNEEKNARHEQGEGVTCCTIHAAKGREWKRVFMVGCDEPERNSAPTIEEERRLFYVAMTRAKDELQISWSKWRPRYNGPSSYGPPELRVRSRFIKEAGL